MPKIQPAQRTLLFQLTPSSGAASVNIDLAKCLSAVNRRLYRQGMQYLVESIHWHGTGMQNVSVAAHTLGDTWMVHNAWKKGFNIWKKQRAEALDHLPGISGKWSDFKIEMDDVVTTATIDCVASDGGSIAPDEWALSQVFWDDDGTERSPTFTMIGSTDPTTKIGLIQEYHISRSRPQTGSPPVDADASDSIYAKMLPMQDELSDALINDIEIDNDAAPYDATEMPGGDTVADAPYAQRIAVSAAASPVGYMDSFTAECGLLRLNVASKNADFSAADDTPIALFVTVAPGAYKGVAAVPMGQ